MAWRRDFAEPLEGFLMPPLRTLFPRPSLSFS